ncbi:Hypothetical predicted protein [Paramuricea clavata]|uniref:Uncharacterized protein n=1 Tax=Paramuricea clavata TaxID=317549 RepID=A0A7D9IAX0_PARCT|nr:Hypothetical predicted protein [Paramuricea clavata]
MLCPHSFSFDQRKVDLNDSKQSTLRCNKYKSNPHKKIAPSPTFTTTISSKIETRLPFELNNKNDSTSRNLWKLAKIEELLSGRDGTIRSAVVKVANDTRNPVLLKRVIQQLIPIEVRSDEATIVDEGEEEKNETTTGNEEKLNHRPRRTTAIAGEERRRSSNMKLQNGVEVECLLQDGSLSTMELVPEQIYIFGFESLDKENVLIKVQGKIINLLEEKRLVGGTFPFKEESDGVRYLKEKLYF